MAESKGGGFVGETVRKKTEAGEKLLESYKQLAKEPYVKVGILEGKADEVKKEHGGKNAKKSKKAKANTHQSSQDPDGSGKDSQNEKGEDGAPNLVQVATFHEFGTSTIPQRSFLRGAISQYRGELNKTTIQVHKQITRGKMTVDQGLRILGEAIQSKVQKRIREGISPALKKATIDRKGSSKPLIDTGQLVNSIRYKTEPEGEGEGEGV